MRRKLKVGPTMAGRKTVRRRSPGAKTPGASETSATDAAKAAETAAATAAEPNGAAKAPTDAAADATSVEAKMDTSVSDAEIIEKASDAAAGATPSAADTLAAAPDEAKIEFTPNNADAGAAQQPPVPPVPPRTGGSGGGGGGGQSPTTTAVIGGALGAVLGAALLFVGMSMTGAFDRAPDPAAEARLAAAETELAALRASVAEFDGSIAAAEAERATLARAQSEIAAASAAAQTRIDEVQSEIAERDKANAGAIVALGSQLRDLKAAAESAAPAAASGPVVAGDEGVPAAAVAAEERGPIAAASAEAPAETTASLAAVAARLNLVSSRVAALEEAGGAAPVASQPEVSSYTAADPAALIALDDRITDLEAQAAAQAEAGGATATPDPAALGALDQRVSALEAKTTDLESAAEGVKTELAAVAEAAASAPAGDAALGVAFSALAAGVASANPYEDAVDTFEKVADMSVDPAIGDPANRGLAGRADLVARFDDASRAALAAVVHPVFRLVVVRRTEAVDAATPQGQVSRAQDALNSGDLRGAVAILKDLPADGRAAMQSWLDDAEARVAAEAALAALRDQMLGAN